MAGRKGMVTRVTLGIGHGTRVLVLSS
jgi:hypothetical protein